MLGGPYSTQSTGDIVYIYIYIYILRSKYEKEDHFGDCGVDLIVELKHKNTACNVTKPIPVAVLSKAWVYGRSLTGIMGSNPA
jgi:hypothetical protein